MLADYLQPDRTEAGCDEAGRRFFAGFVGKWIMLLTFFISLQVKADTIEYWHLYFNGDKISECSRVSGLSTVIIKRSSIKADDSFVIVHFKDNIIAPNQREWSWIEVYKEEDTLKHWILTSDDDFVGGKIIVHLTKIIANIDPNKETYFKFFFIPGPIKNLTDKDKIPLFRFRIE